MRIEARQRIATWKRISKRLDGRGADAFCQFQTTFNRMTATIDLGHTGVEPASSWQCTAHSTDLFGTTKFRYKRAAQQPSKIECKIGSDLSGLFEPQSQAIGCSEAAKFSARYKMNMIHITISSKKRCELGLDNPRDLRVRIRFTHHCDCGKRVNDVTERTRIDD